MSLVREQAKPLLSIHRNNVLFAQWFVISTVVITHKLQIANEREHANTFEVYRTTRIYIKCYSETPDLKVIHFKFLLIFIVFRKWKYC